MDRKEFLKEMKGSFTETMKGILSPFIEEKTYQLDDATAILSGEQWKQLPDVDDSIDWQIRDFYLAEESINLVNQKGQVRAFKKQCPTCKGMLVITTFDKRAKCFMCDQSISLVDFQGDLPVTLVETKKRDDKWFVRLKKM